jgi:hypothetical protein
VSGHTKEKSSETLCDFKLRTHRQNIFTTRTSVCRNIHTLHPERCTFDMHKHRRLKTFGVDKHARTTPKCTEQLTRYTQHSRRLSCTNIHTLHPTPNTFDVQNNKHTTPTVCRKQHPHHCTFGGKKHARTTPKIEHVWRAETNTHYTHLSSSHIPCAKFHRHPSRQRRTVQ